MGTSNIFATLRGANFVRGIQAVIDKFIFEVASRNGPLLEYNLLPVYSNCDDLSSCVHDNRTVAEDLGIDCGFLWGVPVHRTTRPTKRTRMYSHHRMLKPVKNIIPCQHCGTWHEMHTICGKCYDKVRLETDKIKESMLSLNPYKGELMNTEVIVKYENDDEGNTDTDNGSLKPEVENGTRKITIDGVRPSWFPDDLKKRWQFIKPNGK